MIKIWCIETLSNSLKNLSYLCKNLFFNFVTTDICLVKFWKTYSKKDIIQGSTCKNLSCINIRNHLAQIVVAIYILELIFFPCLMCLLFLAEILTMNVWIYVLQHVNFVAPVYIPSVYFRFLNISLNMD